MSAIENLPAQDNGLLRFLTCGSVDDGKSTLIGRLLFDTKTILVDTLHAIERTSKKRGMEAIDLSLLTDGLQAEREQGITIDVAYRYFTTGTRKYIIADAPGHEQYTRNMVTAASTADLAIILIDARKGVLTQTRRHSYLAHLIGIENLVLAVNKMDLVDWSEARFEEIVACFTEFASRLEIPDIKFIPVSALLGDNVVVRSGRMPWFESSPLLYTLETVYAGSDHNHVDARFPVQTVIRPGNQMYHDFRGLAGRVRGVPCRPTQVPGRGVCMAARRAGLPPRDLTPRPGTPKIDRASRTVVTGLHQLEVVQHVLCARGRPHREKTMVVVLEGPAATHGDEPRIPDLGENHQFAHLALVSAKGRGLDRPPTNLPLVVKSSGVSRSSITDRSRRPPSWAASVPIYQAILRR